jgi:hypothetical protein
VASICLAYVIHRVMLRFEETVLRISKQRDFLIAALEDEFEDEDHGIPEPPESMSCRCPDDTTAVRYCPVHGAHT